MSDWYLLTRPPFIYLLLGSMLFCATVVWLCTGKVRTRFQGWVYRAEDPTQYWGGVAVYFLGSVYFIGFFLYRIYVLSQ